jgi:hypothetical protein
MSRASISAGDRLAQIAGIVQELVRATDRFAKG